MRLRDLPPPRNIGISISESPDMRYFGFSDGHLKDAMAGFAIHLLASGANLAYGGDLRDAGFSRLIFDLVLRYRPHRETVPPVANYYSRSIFWDHFPRFSVLALCRQVGVIFFSFNKLGAFRRFAAEGVENPS